MTKFIFVLIIFLLFIWRIKKGFQNGIMREIVTILSGAVSLVSVALVVFAIRGKSPGVFALCVIGLVVLGVVFKVCSLIFRPILALSNISVIGGLNKILGAVMGAAEAAALSCLIYFVLDCMEIYIW